jgi:hypothetical protein
MAIDTLIPDDVVERSKVGGADSDSLTLSSRQTENEGSFSDARSSAPFFAQRRRKPVAEQLGRSSPLTSSFGHI